MSELFSAIQKIADWQEIGLYWLIVGIYTSLVMAYCHMPNILEALRTKQASLVEILGGVCLHAIFWPWTIFNLAKDSAE